MTSTDLEIRTAPAVMGDREIEQLFRVSKALAMSGMFKDTRSAEQAFAKVLIGRDLGLSPTQALMGIHIIEGKPELSANLQAAFVKRTPGYDFKVIELTNEACELAFYRDGEELGRSRFTMDDARLAGLSGKGVWKSYPRNMLYARAMSNGIAFHCPEVTGGVRVYSDGEIGGEEQPPPLHVAAEAPAEAAPQATGREEQQPPQDAEVVEQPAGVDASMVAQLNDELERFGRAGGDFDDLCMRAVSVGGEIDLDPDAPHVWRLLSTEQALDLCDWMIEQRKAAA